MYHSNNLLSTPFQGPIVFVFSALLALASLEVRAAVSADKTAQLKSSLTPLGAEKIGNADGSIPAWDGGLTQVPSGYKGPGTHHVDPFASDKPLFIITKDNLAQYQDRLTPGQIALLNTYPSSFQMPVYPTRRTGAAPQWVYENTFKNASSASLAEEGNGFVDAFGGIPFPIPENGVEAVWNHIARYRGTYVERRSAQAAVEQSGSYSLVSSQDQLLTSFYDQRNNFSNLNNTLFYYMSFATSPARMAGNGALLRETLNQVKEPRQAWIYTPGQRRVRRAPTLAYDTPLEEVSGLRTVDDTDMYNGAPDRYDWTLLGKKEIYIPYNNYKVTSPDVSYKDLLLPGHINPKHTRYELHRVWVVEGKLKTGARHIYSRRTLFLDEDSWGAAVVDQYDSRGELWRVSMAYLKSFYEQPMVWTALDTFHDLQARRYAVQWLDNEESGTADFSKPVPSKDMFNPASLRRRAPR
jgi:hypothetical protein